VDGAGELNIRQLLFKILENEMGFANIWDGEEFRQVSQEEADELVKQDKAQDLSKEILSATDLKFRKDFKGYMTREVRAADPLKAAPKQKPTPVPIIPPTDPLPKPIPIDPPQPASVDGNLWMNYRKAAADLLGKPYNMTTKSETLAYMEKHVGIKST